MTELSKVSVTALKGVGEAMAEKLAKVGLETVQDVLFHLPLRYQDRTRVVPIGALRPGQDAVVEGRVIGADVVAKAQPDGYTFGTVIAGHSANQTLNPKLPFDVVKDFTYVSLMSVAPLMLDEWSATKRAPRHAEWLHVDPDA